MAEIVSGGSVNFDGGGEGKSGDVRADCSEGVEQGLEEDVDMTVEFELAGRAVLKAMRTLCVASFKMNAHREAIVQQVRASNS